jgi:predicted RNA binding protein YcfA (HicA-like mRNA interferase family)
MPPLPVLTARAVVRVLQRAGFRIHHQTGSHVHLRHPAKASLRVVVPFHGRDLAPKTLRSIIAQCEMTVEEFLALL